jgi:tetratricopeptide (TPR) repeat protein
MGKRLVLREKWHVMAEQQAQPTIEPIRIYHSYAHKDSSLRDEFDKHLWSLKRSGKITTWYDEEIFPGTNWQYEINIHLDTADIILLLISPDFIASDYCYSMQMQRALERHRIRKVHVIPILLRPVDLEDTPIRTLQALPTNGKAITQWRSRDEGFLNVAKAIRHLVERLLQDAQDIGTYQMPPQTKEVWTALGDTHYNAERYQEALVAYERALSLAPDDVNLHYYKGYTLLHLKRLKEAVKAFREATLLDPRDPVAPNGLKKARTQLIVVRTRNYSIVALFLIIIVLIVSNFNLLIHPINVTGPPIGFSVTTLHQGQVIQNTDIPLTVQGRYSLEGSGQVWVVLMDTRGQHYLQHPPVHFNGNRTWTATNITPGPGITEVNFVYVTSQGNRVFQQMVANGNFSAFSDLPIGSQVLQSIRIVVSAKHLVRSMWSP